MSGLFIVVDTIAISVLSFVSRCSHFEMDMTTFRLLSASLHQAMRSTGYAAKFISRWSSVLVDFDPHCSGEKLLPQHSVVATTTLLLCFLIVGIHASGI